MDFTECWTDTCSNVAVAARNGSIEYLRLFLQDNKPVDVSDNRGWKPLHEAAAMSPSIECLEELLKHEQTNINWTTHEGETALLLACKRRGQSTANEVVRLLLEYGANPNIKDNEEDSPLLAAVRNSLTEVVDQLLNAGANVNATDCSKWSPLHEAAGKDANIHMLRGLLSKGARIDRKDECGMTPLFTAAQHGAESCLKELLDVAKQRGQENVIDIGAEDWATPLMIASQQGFVNCVKLLLDYGANPNLRTSDQATALHLAVQGNHKECLDILLENMNLQPLIDMFKVADCRREMVCPLHLAVEHNSFDCLQALLAAGFSPDSLYECMGLTITGHIPNLPDQETALCYAIGKRNMAAMMILLEAGASINPPVPSAFHPLARSMLTGGLQEFLILLEKGCHVNYQRPLEPTNEVFLYCLLTNFQYLKSLLHFGCDPNLCFQTGHEVFARCCYRFIRRTIKPAAILDFLRFLLRFLIINKHVQNAFRVLLERLTLDGRDLLEELDQPSSLKQICLVKIRQHFYSIHGVYFCNMIPDLHLPLTLEDYLVCRDLQFPSLYESEFNKQKL